MEPRTARSRSLPLASLLVPCLLLSACGGGGPAATADSRPTQSIEGLTLKRTKKGVLLWTLRADSASLRDSEGVLDLSSPVAEVYEKGRKTSTMTAKTGVFHPDTQDLRLETEVVVTGREAGGQVVLRTDRIDYDSRRELYHTESPVLIERGGSRMKGRGLTANRDLSEIRVKNQESLVR